MKLLILGCSPMLQIVTILEEWNIATAILSVKGLSRTSCQLQSNEVGKMAGSVVTNISTWINVVCVVSVEEGPVSQLSCVTLL